MDTDKAACAEVIQAWGFARDQGRWDDLAAIFHSGGEIAVSWFRGPYPEFVAHCRRNFGKGSEAKHLLWPARPASRSSPRLSYWSENVSNVAHGRDLRVVQTQSSINRGALPERWMRHMVS